VTNLEVMNFEIAFDELPLWKGLQTTPGIKQTANLGLCWDRRGYIRQNTPQNLREDIVKNYSSDEYQFITCPPGSSIWSNWLGSINIDFIDKYYGSLSNRSVIEIGAGSLFIAEEFINKRGVSNYLVIDPAIKQVPTDSRIRVVRDYFSKDYCLDAKYDLIICLNCLEHLLDPVEFLQDIRSLLLRSHGKAILVFPDIEQQFKEGNLNALLHEHLNYFTYDMAFMLFSKVGLRVIKGVTDWGCSRFLVEAIPGKEYNSFEPVPIDPLLPLAALNFQQNIYYSETILKKALNSGEIITFHGATNGLNNILFLTGLYKEKCFLLFDGDENKKGQYLPACRTEVKHSHDPLYKDIDKVFVSAITFFEDIKKFLIARHGLNSEQIIPLFRPMVELNTPS